MAYETFEDVVASLPCFIDEALQQQAAATLRTRISDPVKFEEEQAQQFVKLAACPAHPQGALQFFSETNNSASRSYLSDGGLFFDDGTFASSLTRNPSSSLFCKDSRLQLNTRAPKYASR